MKKFLAIILSLGLLMLSFPTALYASEEAKQDFKKQVIQQSQTKLEEQFKAYNTTADISISFELLLKVSENELLGDIPIPEKASGNFNIKYDPKPSLAHFDYNIDTGSEKLQGNIYMQNDAFIIKSSDQAWLLDLINLNTKSPLPEYLVLYADSEQNLLMNNIDQEKFFQSYASLLAFLLEQIPASAYIKNGNVSTLNLDNNALAEFFNTISNNNYELADLIIDFILTLGLPDIERELSKDELAFALSTISGDVLANSALQINELKFSVDNNNFNTNADINIDIVDGSDAAQLDASLNSEIKNKLIDNNFDINISFQDNYYKAMLQLQQDGSYQYPKETSNFKVSFNFKEPNIDSSDNPTAVSASLALALQALYGQDLKLSIPETSIDNALFMDLNTGKTLPRPKIISESTDINLLINGEKADYAFIKNDRAMISVDDLEKVGFKIDFESPHILISNNGKTAVMQINSTDAYLNDYYSFLNQSPVIYNDKVYVPVYYIASAFNLDLTWDEISRSLNLDFSNDLFQNSIKPVMGEKMYQISLLSRQGLINKNGDLVIKPLYDNIFDLEEEMILIYKNNKYGYLNNQGELAIPLQYEQADNFSEGLAAIKLTDSQWGYINKNGEYIIEPNYDWAGSFNDGIAYVYLNDEEKYINKHGEYVEAPVYDSEIEYFDGLALYLEDNLYGYINETGEIVIKPQFEYAQDFSEGLAAALIKDKYGYINKQGKLTITAQFEDAWSFSEGLAAVKINDKYGFINQKGELVIDAVYDWVWNFYDGIARVEIIQEENDYLNYEQFFINQKGEIVEGVADDYDQELYLYYSEGLAAFEKNGKYGYMDEAKNVVIHPHYDFAFDFRGGIAEVMVNDKRGYINNKGKFIWRPSN